MTRECGRDHDHRHDHFHGENYHFVCGAIACACMCVCGICYCANFKPVFFFFHAVHLLRDLIIIKVSFILTCLMPQLLTYVKVAALKIHNLFYIDNFFCRDDLIANERSRCNAQNNILFFFLIFDFIHNFMLLLLHINSIAAFD